MRSWIGIVHWVHDNIAVIFFCIVAALVGAGWLVVHAFRSTHNRDEMYRLRQRLYRLERESNFVPALNTGPVVLSSRWIGVGAAATTSDGGCLILLEAASPFQRKAMLTVRIDGLPARKNEAITVGDKLEVLGKSGTYTIELHATDNHQARFAISLRTRHLEYAE